MWGKELACRLEKSKERMVREQRDRLKGQVPVQDNAGLERDALVEIDPRNHQMAFKTKRLAVVPEGNG